MTTTNGMRAMTVRMPRQSVMARDRMVVVSPSRGRSSQATA